ncbi:MAG: hypothetical protein M1812_004309 [Candelaria pacifica]|nr:MAG: hypothetical protein M1812_004309 [Candelaria pacifica]
MDAERSSTAEPGSGCSEAPRQDVTGVEFVKPVKAASPQKIILSPVDRIMPNTYVCWVLLFPLSDDRSPEDEYHKLRAGLSLTLSEYPFIGGYLSSENSCKGEEVSIRVDAEYGIRLVRRNFDVDDGSGDAMFGSSYAELKQKHFPISALDQNEIQPFPYTVKTPTPRVMGAQVNFISGGVILSTCVVHRACDALGVSVILKAWAKNTRLMDARTCDVTAAICNLSMTESLMDRTSMSGGLKGARLQDHPEYRVLEGGKGTDPGKAEIVAAGATTTASKPPTGPLKFCVFYLSAAQLSHLKSAAFPPQSSNTWISTNDAICALLWRHISRARARSGHTPENSASKSPPLNFIMAVEARRRMSPAIPKGYAGNAVFCCPITSDLHTVTSPSTPLHEIALLFRDAVTGYDSAKMSGVIGLINSMAKPTDLMVRIADDPMHGMIATSWADTGLYELDWGSELGKPESVRVPDVPLEGATPICGIFPRLPDGGLEILVSLDLDEIEVLKCDEEFGRFTEWRGR